MSTPSQSHRSTWGAFLDAVRAELAKLCTLPSTWLTVVGTVACALGLVFALVAADEREGLQTATLVLGMAPVGYVQAGFLVLGALAGCGEYVGSQVRTTLTVLPNRHVQRTAAAIALLVVAVTAAAATVLVQIITALILLTDRPAPTLREVVGTCLGAVGYLTLMSLFASGVGVLVRRSLPTVAILLGYVLLIGPVLRDRFEWSRYLPEDAGRAMWSASPTDAGTAWTTVAVWALACLLLAGAIYHRRDA